MAGCEGCPWGGLGRTLRGAPDAPYVLIGDTTSTQEQRYGTAVRSDGSLLLEGVMQGLGLEAECAVVQSLGCHPELKGSGIEEELCRPSLLRFLEQYPRKAVVALGATALQMLVPETQGAVHAHRGQWLTSPYTDVPVLATLHPTAVHLQQHLYRLFASDLGKVPAGPTPVGTTTYTVATSEDQAHAMVAELLQADTLSFDIETTGLDWRKNRIILLGFSKAAGHTYIFPWEYVYTTKPLFAGPLLVGHNSKFDLKFLRHAGIPARVSHDTMLLHYVLDEHTGGHGLKALAADLLGAVDYEGPLDAYKKEHKIGGDYSKIPASVLLPYLAMDADYTLRLYYLLRAQVEANPALWTLYTRLLLPAAQMLMEAEERGIYVDQEQVASARSVLEARLAEAHANVLLDVAGTWNNLMYLFDVKQQGTRALLDKNAARIAAYKERSQRVATENLLIAQKNTQSAEKKEQLRREAANYERIKPISATKAVQLAKPAVVRKLKAEPKAPIDKEAALNEVPFNPGSHQQVRWFLQQQRLWVQSTDASTLAGLLERGDIPFVRHLLAYRKAQKSLGTYVEAVEKAVQEDGRIRAVFNLTTTVTGRLSSSEPINLQNIPRDLMLRGMFGAPPGRVIVEADYSQAELRVLGHLSFDPFLLDTYQAGRDLHDDVARSIFGPGFTKEQRTAAKTINFGIAYGLSAHGLSAQLGISQEQAQEMITSWYARLPKAKAYLDSCKRAPLEGKVLVTPFGRHRRYGLVNAGNQDAVQREASNFVIQSTASDLTLLSAITLAYHLPARAGIVNIVHDSILVECDEADGEAVARLMLQVLRSVPARALRSSLPFDADAKIGRHWSSDAEKFEEAALAIKQEIAV